MREEEEEIIRTKDMMTMRRGEEVCRGREQRQSGMEMEREKSMKHPNSENSTKCFLVVI
jgi:hypothetical protein